MAVIEYDSYKQKLLAMDETFENLFKALEIEQARQELNRLELEAHEDGFWNDLERSQKNQMRSKQLQNKIHRYEKLISTRDDLLALIDMGTEMDDASLLPELEEGYSKLEADVEHDAPFRRIRQLQRDFDVPRWRGRHRGAGLGADALPHVYAVGEQARL
jgi:peptide chain release factor 2